MRPKANQIRQHEFFSRQECPKQLPFSAMVASPRVNQALASETIQVLFALFDYFTLYYNLCLDWFSDN
jgi:hypothetical protein